MMGKKSLLAITIAIIFPLSSYYILSYFSNRNVVVPQRYFYDSVRVVDQYGKATTDTVWHKVKNFTLTNQLGKNVSLSDLEGKIIVADFFFTSCPSICPSLTRNMKQLQDAFKKNENIVQFISFSVDPVRDSVPKLKAYADKYGVNHDNWWFLTGNKEDIYNIAKQEFKANIADAEVDTNFIHTEHFFVLDKERVIRGWYKGLDSTNLNALARDVVLIMMEREKKKKRSLFGKKEA